MSGELALTLVNALERRVEVLERAATVPARPAPAYNHTRGDSPMTPCPECAPACATCVALRQERDPAERRPPRVPRAGRVVAGWGDAVLDGARGVTLQAPFPWFGGKSRAADLIWQRLGAIDNYVEPFAGSLAVLLGSPSVARTETVNDLDGFVANFWRATAVLPEEVAAHADWPVNEADLHARHVWLVNNREELTARLMGDPDFCDAKVAGWWCWGICCWIGSGWCSGEGPWQSVDGQLVHLGDAGRGVNRKRVHLGNAGQGVNRQLVHLGNAGGGGEGLYDWFRTLGERLRHVRVCCGDWQRVCGPTPTVKLGLTGVVLDPPYAEDERTADLYAKDDGSVSAAVRAWAIEHGDDERMRIVLCGYDTEHAMPDGWERVGWVAKGGYGSQALDHDNANAARETLWFSPHCLGGRQRMLFGDAA